MSNDSIIHPVILSGGSGTRLWPISRRDYPKQFIPLVNNNSPLQDTALRSVGDGLGSPTVICSDAHRFIVAEQMAGIGCEAARIVLEPVGRNTCPAAAVAAILIHEVDPEGSVLLMPSDHLVTDPEAFHRGLAQARRACEQGYLVTFGMRPDRPETGYGYIKTGSAVDGAEGCFLVEKFVEKPDLATANVYLESGDFHWNSGIFLFRADRFLEELERHAPDVLSAARDACSDATKDPDFVRLPNAAFRSAPSISIDYAVMEKTERAAVLPMEMGWSDLGSWESLWGVAEKDESGNVCLGGAIAVDSQGSYVRSEGPLTAVLGLEDVVVVATDDALLVTSKERAQEVNAVVKLLDDRGSDTHVSHSTVRRPWGSFKGLETGERFQVKRIEVKPGASLSLQLHHHRAEHWIVVNGTALVTRGEDKFLLQENESTYIPLGTKHRLENPGKVPLQLIEVQSGSYLGEDDIVRFEDVYGREDEEVSSPQQKTS